MPKKKRSPEEKLEYYRKKIRRYEDSNINNNTADFQSEYINIYITKYTGLEVSRELTRGTK